MDKPYSRGFIYEVDMFSGFCRGLGSRKMEDMGEGTPE